MVHAYDIGLEIFEKDIETFYSDTIKEAVDLHKFLCQFILINVAEKTPKDTGQASKSWLVSINEFIPEDRQSDLQTELAKLDGLQLLDVVYIHNSVPYILVLEEGLFRPPDPGPSKDPRAHRKGRILVEAGYSTQAPLGMLGLTIEEARHLFND